MLTAFFLVWQSKPPDVWAAFLLHHAQGESGNCRKQCSHQFAPVCSPGTKVSECKGDVSPTIVNFERRAYNPLVGWLTLRKKGSRIVL
jgi:hypothetical protein